MKVLFNTCSYAFDCPGGGEVQFLKTFDVLKSKGIPVELYNQWEPNFSSFDLVHFFTVQQGMSSFCEFVKSKNIPLALSPIFWPKPNVLRGQMWEIEKMLNLADIIFPNSIIEANMLSNMFDVPIDKFHVTYNGIDLNEFEDKADLKLSVDRDIGDYLVCIGNIEPRKNQLSILNAIKRSRFNLRLVSIGNVRDKAYMSECEKYGNIFDYKGFLSRTDSKFISLVKNAKAFILPSLFETPGLAALEAAYLGAKIIITSEGSTREYFGNSVLYVDPLDSDSISRAIENIDKLAGSDIVKDIEHKFTWRVIGDQVIEGYKKIMEVQL